jgi:hypothetical protein
MNDDFLKLRTSIKPDLMRSVLFRGSFLGGLGVILLAATGAFLPVPILSRWGIPIFLTSMGLIAVGMLPYRKLTRLEKNPDEILISEDEQFVYRRKGKVVFAIPLSSINSCTYVDDASHYGIEITLKEGQKYFLPYFTDRTRSQIERYRAS